MATVSHFRRWAAALLAALALVLCAALPARAEDSTGAIGGASFSVEQVYVNVPEMNIFLYDADQNGQSISPTMVQAAGVELKLGSRTIPTGTIGQAAEPICYLFVVDNGSKVDDKTFTAFKTAMRKLMNARGEKDQMAIFTTAGGADCVLEATSDHKTIWNAIRGLERAEGRMDVMTAATDVYGYVTANYQSLAPRKVIFVLSSPDSALSNLTLAAAMAGGKTDQLNMALYAYVLSETPELMNSLADMTNGHMVFLEPDALTDALLEKVAHFAQALEIRTDLPEDSYGEKLELLTVSVPKLGSAVTSTSTVYMGHKLTKPAVETVEVAGRNQIRLTFNQAVQNADRPGCYIISSEDIWNYRVLIESVELAENGRTALLTTREPLYQGRFAVRLNKVTSKMTASNISDAAAETTFEVADWPRDKGFYLARFRLPVLLLGGFLLVLIVLTLLARRREREAERSAEAEHLLSDAASAGALPRKWVTLFVKTRRSIAESRWSGMVESSLILGSDPAQCDLLLDDKRVLPQHCAICVDGDALLARPRNDARVYVNGDSIAGEFRLQNNDTITLGRTTIQLVL